MKELIQGAYDLHVHSFPDVCGRKIDDLSLAKRILDCGMAGFAMKNHFICTAPRAALVRQQFPSCDAVGGIALNNAVGGINPIAVEMAARAGAEIVWLPSCDAAHELYNIETAQDKSKLGFLANIVISLQHDGIDVQPLSVFAPGTKELSDQVVQVLQTIKKNGMILATSHCSHEETFALVKFASQIGIEKILVTHVTFPNTFYSVEEQKALLEYGAVMEHCYTTYSTGKTDFSVILDQIRRVGPAHVLLSTDIGPKSCTKYPDEALEDFADLLYENGISEKDIHTMLVDNPKRLLGR